MNFTLDHFLPYKLSLATNTVSQQLSGIYTGHDLTRTQWRVMAVIDEAPRTAGEVSAKTMMDKATISRAVGKLVERNILKREVSQEDGRCSPLRLTNKGQAIFKDIAPKALIAEKQILKNFSMDELKTLERLLNILLSE